MFQNIRLDKKRIMNRILIKILNIIILTLVCVCFINAEELHLIFIEKDGKQYWYENNIKQGIYGSKGNVFYDGIERGREIFDPNTNAWYWLDALYDGAKAVNKEVFMPYIYAKEKDLFIGEYEIINHPAEYRTEKVWIETKPASYEYVITRYEFGTSDNGYKETVYPPFTQEKMNAVVDRVSEYCEAHGTSWGFDTYGDDIETPAEGYYQEKQVKVKDAWDETIIKNNMWNEGALKEISKESDIYTESNFTANMSEQVYVAIMCGTGKWVRYDSEGKMIKGWYKVEEKDRQYYPDQVGNIYFYDYKTGLMAKGKKIIDDKEYYFDEVSGVLNENNLSARRY